MPPKRWCCIRQLAGSSSRVRSIMHRTRLAPGTSVAQFPRGNRQWRRSPTTNRRFVSLIYLFSLVLNGDTVIFSNVASELVSARKLNRGAPCR